MRIKGDVMFISHRCILRGLFLHLIGADVDWLDESPLKSALAAITRKIAFRFADPGHVSASRSIAGSARFLIVDSEV
jgi:hypothetical protein